MTPEELFSTPAFADNELWRILCLFLALVFTFAAGKVLRYLLKKRADQIVTQRPIIAASMNAAGKAAPFLAFSVGLATGISFLKLGPAAGFINTTVAIIITLAVAFTTICLVEVISTILMERSKRTESKMDDMLAPILSKSLKATIIILTVVQIAQILSGKEITSILAGLGIGGLAFALAAQDTIKNFFGSMVLLSDKPFEIGDRINVDGYDGPVEAVGLRSTRIRTLDGHLVTIPNGELANKSIWNIAKRPYIRRLFNITITYDTPPEKVREAKAIIEDILANHEGMSADFPPRCYFNDFLDASLNLICIYWYHPPAYWDFLAFTESVNLQILERFNAAGIDFAFPTQTLHLAGDASRDPIQFQHFAPGDPEKR